MSPNKKFNLKNSISVFLNSNNCLNNLKDLLLLLLPLLRLIFSEQNSFKQKTLSETKKGTTRSELKRKNKTQKQL